MNRNREFPEAETGMTAQFGESSSNAGSVHLHGERLGSVISNQLAAPSRFKRENWPREPGKFGLAVVSKLRPRSDRRANAFLSDFGSAAKVDAQGEAAAVLGTDVYRPPEAKATGRVSRSADLYGTGMTLFEMLNGRLFRDRNLVVDDALLVEAFSVFVGQQP